MIDDCICHIGVAVTSHDRLFSADVFGDSRVPVNGALDGEAVTCSSEPAIRFDQWIGFVVQLRHCFPAGESPAFVGWLTLLGGGGVWVPSGEIGFVSGEQYFGDRHGGVFPDELDDCTLSTGVPGWARILFIDSPSPSTTTSYTACGGTSCSCCTTLQSGYCDSNLVGMSSFISGRSRIMAGSGVW